MNFCLNFLAPKSIISFPEIFDNLVLNFVGIGFENVYLDPPYHKDIKGDSDVVVCVPRFLPQQCLIDEGMFKSEGHICEIRKHVLLILVVIFDEGTFSITIPRFNIWGHFNNLINLESDDIKEFEKVNR